MGIHLIFLPQKFLFQDYNKTVKMCCIYILLSYGGKIYLKTKYFKKQNQFLLEKYLSIEKRFF